VEVIWSNRPLRQQLRLPEATLATADQEMR
jgi:hypothetical protein